MSKTEDRLMALEEHCKLLERQIGYINAIREHIKSHYDRLAALEEKDKNGTRTFNMILEDIRRVNSRIEALEGHLNTLQADFNSLNSRVNQHAMSIDNGEQQYKNHEDRILQIGETVHQCIARLGALEKPAKECLVEGCEEPIADGVNFCAGHMFKEPDELGELIEKYSMAVEPDTSGGWQGQDWIIPCRSVLHINGIPYHVLDSGDVLRIVLPPQSYQGVPAEGNQHEGGHVETPQEAVDPNKYVYVLRDRWAELLEGEAALLWKEGIWIAVEDTLREEAMEAGERLATAHKQLKEAEAAVGVWQQKAEEKASLLLVTEQELQRIRNVHSDFPDRLAEAHANMKQYQRDLNERTTELVELRKHLAGTVAANDVLRKDLAQCRQVLQRVTKANPKVVEIANRINKEHANLWKELAGGEPLGGSFAYTPDLDDFGRDTNDSDYPADAALGALVRRMPEHMSLLRMKLAPGWVVNTEPRSFGATPEEALSAALATGEEEG